MITNPVSLLGPLIERDISERFIDVNPIIDKQISKLRKKLKTYETKEKNLISLLSHDSVTKEYVFESINNLKQERMSDKKQPEGLLKSRKQSSDNKPTTFKLSEISEDLRNEAVKIANSNDLEAKRNVLNNLQLQVTADPKSHEFNFTFMGVLTSSSQARIRDFITEHYYELEKQHPEISLDDIINPDVILPEDSTFCRIINPVKKNLQREMQDLVTIE